MKLVRLLFAAVTFLFSVINPVASEESLSELFSAKTLKCYMENGTSADWDNGKLKIKTGDYGKEPVIFDNIDIKAGTARGIANQGAVNVSVLATLSGLTFLEKTGSGNLSIFTVFTAKDEKSGKYYCVESRHMLIAGPIPQQYYGTCQIMMN